MQKQQLFRLLPGLFLLIIVLSPLRATAATLADSATQPGETDFLYVIRPGDTLWQIAVAHRVTVEQLLASNNQLGDPRLLRPGHAIRIPVASGQAATVQPASAAPEQPASPKTTPTVTPAAIAGNTPASALGINPLALDMLNRINETRLAGGRAALTWNDQLAAAAQAHAEDCAHRNRGSHIGSDGARLATRLQRAGYSAIWSGENWANAQSVAHAMAIWLNEPPGADPHVQNIMSARATEIGIGVARGPWGYYFVVNFASR